MSCSGPSISTLLATLVGRSAASNSEAARTLPCGAQLQSYKSRWGHPATAPATVQHLGLGRPPRTGLPRCERHVTASGAAARAAPGGVTPVRPRGVGCRAAGRCQGPHQGQLRCSGERTEGSWHTGCLPPTVVQRRTICHTRFSSPVPPCLATPCTAQRCGSCARSSGTTTMGHSAAVPRALSSPGRPRPLRRRPGEHPNPPAVPLPIQGLPGPTLRDVGSGAAIAAGSHCCRPYGAAGEQWAKPCAACGGRRTPHPQTSQPTTASAAG